MDDGSHRNGPGRGPDPAADGSGASRSGVAWLKTSVWAAVAVLVVTSAWNLRRSLIDRRLPAPGEVVDVRAGMAGFDRPVIRVRAGQPVTIRLTAEPSPFEFEGVGQHQLAIDELDVDIVAPPGGSANTTFTPGEVGTYEFYCDVCCGGRSNPSMTGELVVVGA